MDLEKLFRYLPKQHGEHGVDATIYMLCKKQNSIHEVFSNPPGGSWTQFDILKPNSDEIYRWDHMPRVPPKAKRPDSVLQFNDNKEMNFILLESKEEKSEIYADMGKLLTNFFLGSPGYIGLKDRPAWHYRKINELDWKFIPPDDDEKLRYWFKLYNKSLVKFWPGFVFALQPEHYETKSSIPVQLIEKDLESLLNLQKQLDVIICVGWCGEHHLPFAIKKFSQNFQKTNFATKMDKLLEPVKL